MLLGGLTSGEMEVGSPGFWAVGQRSQETNFLDPYLCLVSGVIPPPPRPSQMVLFLSLAVYTIPPLPTTAPGELSDLWTVLQNMFPNDQVHKDLRLACVGLFWGWWVRLRSLWHAWPLASQN